MITAKAWEKMKQMEEEKKKAEKFDSSKAGISGIMKKKEEQSQASPFPFRHQIYLTPFYR